MDFDPQRVENDVQEKVIPHSQQLGETLGHYMYILSPDRKPLHQDENKKPVFTPGEHCHSPSTRFCSDDQFSPVSLESRERNPPPTSKSPQSRTVNSEDHCAETKENFDPVKYTCGGCNKHFSLICQLHHHLLTHLESGTYIYNIDTKTAYPRYDSICRAVQTFDCKSDVLTDNYTREQDENRENDMVEGIHEEQKEVDRNKEDQKAFDFSSKGFVKSKRKAKKLSNERNKNALLSPVKDLKSEGSNTDNCRPKRKGKQLNDKKSGNPLLSPIKKPDLERNNTENYQNGNSEKRYMPQASEIKVEIDKNLSSFASERVVIDKLEQNQETEKGQLNTGHHYDDYDLIDENSDKVINDSDTDSYQSDFIFDKIDADKSEGATEKKYKCEHCHASYKFESMLDVHRFKIHGEKKQVLHDCRWCHEVFKFKKDLIIHITSCSKNVGLKCCICGKIFSSRRARIKHMNSHQNKEDLKCKICGKVVEKWQSMERHMKGAHVPINAQCDKCGKAFTYKHLVTKHKVYCTEDKPFSCSKCDMKFRTIHSLRHHYSVHSDDKPFVCQYCGYTGTNLAFLHVNPLPDNKILDWSKLKQIADDILKCI